MRAPRADRLLPVAALLVGCGDPVAEQCPGQVRPAIEDCFRGGFFADCGGTGEPVLGCDEGSDDCRWFSGGCAAAGYVASGCPADDICCRDDSPFTQDQLTFDQSAQIGWQLYGWGTQPWDRDRAMNVQVHVVTAPAQEPYACTGDDPYQGNGSTPCTGFTQTEGATVEIADYVIVWPSTEGFGGWTPVIEIDPDRMLARVCTYQFTDVFGATCPSEFTRARTVCASSGRVELSAIPDGAASVTGYVDVGFETFTLTGSFAAGQ